LLSMGRSAIHSSIAVVATGVLLLSGCGKFFSKVATGGGGCTVNCTTASNFAYVANQRSAGPGVAGFSISNSGILTAVSGSPNSLGVLPTALAINPANTFLYAGSSSGQIFLYAINSVGSLTAQNSGNPVATIAAAAMQVDSTGAWLIVANAAGASVTAFGINSTTGLLTTPTGGSITLNGGVGFPSRLVITPGNNFAYVSLGTAGVEVLTFSSSDGTVIDAGHLTSEGGQNSDQGLAVDSASRFLFITETGVNAVRVMTIGGSGALTEVAGSPFTTGLGPSAILVDATSSYVYVTNRTDGTLSEFVLTNSGTLVAVPGSAIATGSTPVAIAEDKSETYVMIVSAGGGPDLQLFTFDATTPGKLDPVSGGSAATGTDPTIPVAIAATH
jgi:6-phosphogluconolactonase